MKYFLRFFVFAGIATALCLIAGCQDRSSSSQKGGGHNLFQGDAPRYEIEGRILRGTSEGAELNTEETTNHFVSLTIIVVLVAVSLITFFGWQFWRQKRKEREQNDPNGLLKELNNAHQLSEPEKRLMQTLSEKHALSSPLVLFVEPKFLLDALESNAFVSARPSVRRLLSKLFDIDTGQEGAGEETVLITRSSLP